MLWRHVSIYQRNLHSSLGIFPPNDLLQLQFSVSLTTWIAIEMTSEEKTERSIQFYRISRWCTLIHGAYPKMSNLTFHTHFILRRFCQPNGIDHHEKVKFTWIAQIVWREQFFQYIETHRVRFECKNFHTVVFFYSLFFVFCLSKFRVTSIAASDICNHHENKIHHCLFFPFRNSNRQIEY